MSELPPTIETATEAAADVAPASAAPKAARIAKVKKAAKPRVAPVKLPAAPAVTAVRKPKRKVVAAPAKRKYVRKPALKIARRAAANPITNSLFEGFKTMDNSNWFAGFTQVPGADKFQSLLTDAGAKSQDAVKKTQALAEQLTETAKANLEAVVESSKIAAAGARDLGTEIVATTKSSVEQAQSAVKTLAEAKSPTEFFQLQSELFRSSFDRMVADGSKLTEQFVKLAGEAVQPLSNRASVNAEKYSELTA